MPAPTPEVIPTPLLRFVRAAMEGVVLLLAMLSPWYFAGIEAPAVFGIHLGVSLLLILWSVRIVLERNLPWRRDLALYCLLGFVALNILQIIPLPTSILGIISPKTVQTWQELIPEKLEQLPGEPLLSRPAMFPISLAPEETRRFLFGFMNLLVIYCVTRFYLISKEAFRRLAWCCLVNGTALSLFGLIQHYSSPHDAIYFTERIEGAGVFSTFVCRNHFPDYAALCFGLAATVLSVTTDETSKKSKKKKEAESSETYWVAEILDDPRLLWLILSLSTLFIGIIFSLSRGGILSFGVAAGVCGLIWFIRGGGSIGPILWVAPLGLVLVYLLGVAPVDARIDSMTGGFQNESRWEIWKQAMNVVPNFLSTGTGNGTFGTVEPMGRFTPGNSKWMMEMAHNEYVEAAFEGGILRLLLTLALVGIFIYTALRALPKLKGRSAATMIIACLFGLIALAVHSIVDFGIHMPSVAILATVVLAHLMGWSSKAHSRPAPTPIRGSFFAIPILLILAALLTWEGYQFYLADEAIREARELGKDSKSDHLRRRIELLQSAIRHEPRDGQTHLNLGQLYLQASERFPKESNEGKAFLLAALREWREARNRSPVMAVPHARLGVFRDSFEQADTVLHYFERVRRGSPNDPDIWYVLGNVHFEAGEWELAWKDWKQSLAFGPDRLDVIARKASTQLNPSAMIDTFLVPDPMRLLRVVELLYPKKETGSPERLTYLRRAAELLEEQNPTVSADLIRLAGLYRETEQYPKAIECYRKAVEQNASQVSWRIELAQTYREAGNLAKASEELQKLVKEDRATKESSDLLKVVLRERELEK